MFLIRSLFLFLFSFSIAALFAQNDSSVIIGADITSAVIMDIQDGESVYPPGFYFPAMDALPVIFPGINIKYKRHLFALGPNVNIDSDEPNIFKVAGFHFQYDFYTFKKERDHNFFYEYAAIYESDKYKYVNHKGNLQEDRTSLITQFLSYGYKRNFKRFFIRTHFGLSLNYFSHRTKINSVLRPPEKGDQGFDCPEPFIKAGFGYTFSKKFSYEKRPKKVREKNYSAFNTDTAFHKSLAFKINPSQLFFGENAVIGCYRYKRNLALEIKLGYQRLFFANNTGSEEEYATWYFIRHDMLFRGPIIQVGLKKYYNNDRNKTRYNSLHILYKFQQLEDRFDIHNHLYPPYNQVLYNYGSVTGKSNTFALKGITGIEFHGKKLIKEIYGGFGLKYVNVSKLIRNFYNFKTNMNDYETIENKGERIFPTFHLGFNIGIEKIVNIK